jgi:TPR repeat protein
LIDKQLEAAGWKTGNDVRVFREFNINDGVMYDNARGVAQNYQEAVKWYTLAAEQGLAGAQYNLGRIYANGTGVVQNFQEAVKWYRLAAEQANTTAQVNLGEMYENGRGVDQDPQRAYVWFSVVAAAARGTGADSYAESTAARRRNEIRQQLTPQALEAAQAQATRCFESNYQDCD